MARLIAMAWLIGLGSCTFAFDLSSLSEQCAPNEKPCGASCVPNDDPMTGCNRAECDPCVVTGGSAKCDDENQCVLDTCYYPYENCDDNPYNGCETNLATFVAHCGGCHRPACGSLTLEHVKKNACINPPNPLTDRCGIAECDVGWGDCNGEPVDGCEVRLADSSHHCGSCDTPCDASAVCVEGHCIVPNDVGTFASEATPTSAR